MERSRASKNKFQMRSPFKGSISEFMAMGKTLGNSKTSNYVAIDPSKHYKAPTKEADKEPESAVDQDKRETAESRNKARAAKNKKTQNKAETRKLDSNMPGPTIDYKGDLKFKSYPSNTQN